jgi:hypothetical protein
MLRSGDPRPARAIADAREPETRPLLGSRVRASGWPILRGLLQAAGHTGPPERLTRGVESGGGRREAAGRAGEGRWMEGMEGWRGGEAQRAATEEAKAPAHYIAASIPENGITGTQIVS